MQSNDSIILDACSGSSCTTSFLIHSVQKKGYLEQLVFESEISLIDAGLIKNTCVEGHVPLGVGFNSEYPLLVLVPIGQKTSEDLKVSIIHTAPTAIKLRLKYPKDVALKPTR